MKLILVRHGETKEGKKGIILGRLPGQLTAKGKKESLFSARKIKSLGLKPDVIISSDLARAKETARIIGKELKLSVKYEVLLRERSAGESEGKKESEINWKEYEKRAKPFRRHPGGESFIEVKKRAEKFVRKVRTKTGGNIVIVSHSVFLAMLLSVFKKWPIEKSLAQNFNSNIVVVDI